MVSQDVNGSTRIERCHGDFEYDCWFWPLGRLASLDERASVWLSRGNVARVTCDRKEDSIYLIWWDSMTQVSQLPGPGLAPVFRIRIRSVRIGNRIEVDELRLHIFIESTLLVSLLVAKDLTPFSYKS